MCYNILRNKTSLVIWFSPTVDPRQIRITVLYYLKLDVYLWNILLCQSRLFFNKGCFFCDRIFAKEDSNGSRGVILIEKQYLMVRIFRRSHLQVVIYILNGRKLYEICSRTLFRYCRYFKIYYFPELLLMAAFLINSRNSSRHGNIKICEILNSWLK